jgi:DNA mismatch repair ATPase MutS
MLKLTKETGADAARAIQFYGEVDAYVSMAQFVVDHQVIQNNAGEPIRVCYSEFIENSHESILSAVNVWHPIISSGSVRPSSITLGGSPANPRNAVVTGPNAAGKSVSLKSLLVNSIMAQTFGIACAESFKLTPFTKIIGRLNAPDDTASDHSKFMLEALDVVSMLTQLKSLKPTEHAFVVTDELFSGTEVGPAIELSKKLCKRVGEMKNVMYMLATHYKDLTSLKDATGNAFENYKVSVTKRADGSLDYPFKLTRGVGSTNVAFDIFLQQMNQQGLGDDDLKNMIIDARRAQETQEAT